MSEGNRTLIDRFKELSPALRIGIIGAAALVLIMAVLVLKPASKSYKATKTDINTPLVKADMLMPKPQDRTVEQLSGELSQQQRTLEKLQRTIERKDEDQRLLLTRLDDAMKQLKLGGNAGGLSEEVIEQMRALQERIDLLEANEALGVDPGQLPSLDMAVTASENVMVESVAPVPPKILVVGGKKADGGRKSDSLEERVPYVTANSMFEGQLLNGMDAPTDQSAKQTPVPAVIRIKSEAILPSLYNVPDVQECFISVAGYGDMADERAKMRTETLSCIVGSETPGKPPRIIEAKVDGYVVGEDGKVGMRGRLISKQGQLIAKTLLAGMASGLGDALKPKSIQGLDINPGNTVETQRYDGRTIGESAIAQGISDSAKSVSQYYLKLADQMMPVVEIDAGRKVTVVLLKGVELK